MCSQKSSTALIAVLLFCEGYTCLLAISLKKFYLLSNLLSNPQSCKRIYYLEQANTIQTAVVRKACKGDGEAQALLYRQYSKAMFNICMRMTGNRNDAEDILQDAFIQAFRKLHQLRDAMQFGGWLKRIVVNECIRFSKKQVSWGEWDAKCDNTPSNEEPEWWKAISLDIIHREIKNLPGGCRQVFNLYVLEDYSHKDIADNLGISESTSKSQYHRARQLLKANITKQLRVHG